MIQNNNMKKTQKSKKDFTIQENQINYSIFIDTEYVSEVYNIDKNITLKFDYNTDKKILYVLNDDFENVMITYK